MRYGCGHRTRTLCSRTPSQRTRTIPSFMHRMRIFEHYPSKSRTTWVAEGYPLYCNGEDGAFDATGRDSAAHAHAGRHP